MGCAEISASTVSRLPGLSPGPGVTSLRVVRG
jgi:hypothetical protein